MSASDSEAACGDAASDDTVNTQDRIPDLEDYMSFETKLATYEGPDPLANWVEYCRCVADEAKFAVLQRCINVFEHAANYKNDPRFCRIWIQYAETRY